MNISRIIIIVISSIGLIGGVLYAAGLALPWGGLTESATNGYLTPTTGSSKDIALADASCIRISSSTSTQYFIPTKTSPESTAFQNNLPSGISVGSCANPVNGKCGTSHGNMFSTKPTTNLCDIGAPTTVMGSGPWTWSCKGVDGGIDANCSAGYTTDPVYECNDSVAAGGEGDTWITQVMGAYPGTIRLGYQTYTVKDRLSVYYNGVKVAGTIYVGGHGELVFPYNPVGSNYAIQVRVEGPAGTAWKYQAKCVNDATAYASDITGGGGGGGGDPPPPPCFIAGTQVSLADGSYKNIEDVKVGDSVITYDEKTNSFINRPVTEALHHSSKIQTLIEFKYGGKTLTSNDIHLLYIVEDGHYVSASDIYNRWMNGEKLSFLDATTHKATPIVSISKYTKDVPLYNLHVSGKYDSNSKDDIYKFNHNYIVNGIVAHNIKMYEP